MIWFAIFSDVGVSLLAIINSLRITGIFKKEYKVAIEVIELLKGLSNK